MKLTKKKLLVATQRKKKTPLPDSEEFLLDFSHYENEARRMGYSHPAGIDEAGRGPLAGPVVASACILPAGYHLSGLNDSKKLTPLQRKRFFEVLTQDPNVCIGIGIATHEEIDTVNVLEATKLAMCKAVDMLKPQPDFLLIDAVKLSEQPIPFLNLIKGDCRVQAIAAASVIAKETRDRIMDEYDVKWPMYGFGRHKGYGTEAHREAIKRHGPCPIHRKTFEPIKSMP
ncbi:ribonuclease HII [Waddlia chondrophila]|uniref:ribonuclease HII n=1 Tax=Waddlia chondrophila TaxID=71667 RepID=UPI00145F1929|nr:ribonuclease HII [Waddlia chondrophila]